MSLFRNTVVQASMTSVSRVLGFARDVILAARIGAGPVGDAFYTALQFPNLFRRVFAEGAFSQAFVPIYARTLEGEGKERAEIIASDTISVLTFATLGLTILAQITMPWIMLALFFGYRNDAETFRLAIILTQITMPYLVFMAISALFAGVLNTAGRFALSAGAPTLLNLSLLVAAISFKEPVSAAVACSVGVTIGGVLQATLLWWGCRRQGVVIRPHWPKLTKDVRGVIALAIPGSLAASVTQINIMISQALASMEEGAKSWLNFADRLYQLPLGLVGVAIGAAILPRLARAAAASDQAAGRRTMDDALVLSMAFTLPAAAALMAMPFFLTDGLFVRGAFTTEDAAMTAQALFHFAWGVPAFVLAKVFAPPFFARRDTLRPMLFALASVIANITIGVTLFFYLQGLGMHGFPGLAVATSAASWLNAGLLGGVLFARGEWRPAPAALARLARVGIATAVMAAGVVLAAANRATVEAWLFGSKEVAVGAAILGGAVLYAAAAFAIRAVTVADVRLALRKEPGAGGPDLPPPSDGG